METTPRLNLADVPYECNPRSRDSWVNPFAAGKYGGAYTSGTPMHGLSFSATIAIPANGFVVFARE